MMSLREHISLLRGGLFGPSQATERAIARLEAEERNGGLPPIKTIGEFVRAATTFAATGDNDLRLKRAPTGAGETGATIGGFLVAKTIAEPIIETIFSDRNSVLSYFKRFVIPDGKNTIDVPGVDETRRANGFRWGGIVADFVDEGILQTTSFPKLKSTQFSTEKMLALVPLSNELLNDVENLDAYLKTAIADELSFKLEQYSLTAAGTGTGRPLSIMHSPALITIAAETGQQPGTIVAENVQKMWDALPSASRKRAIWAASESGVKQLQLSGYSIYPQSGATNPGDLPRLLGRPLIESDTLPIVGASGDIMLIDPEWYGVAAKEMRVAMSADVAFLSDQTYLRCVLRCDANPLVSAPLTASDGTKRSPFVALAAR